LISRFSSQTSVSDSDKKIHQSWGGDEGQTELATETAAANDAAAEQAAPAENWEPTGGGEEWGAEASNTEWGAGGGGGGDTEWGAEAGSNDWAAPAPASTTNANAEEPAERSDRRPRDRQEDEPDNTLTLDQYLAQQKEKSSVIPQLAIRKIEQDEGLWKGAKELVKGTDEGAYFVGKVRITCAPTLAHTYHGSRARPPPRLVQRRRRKSTWRLMPASNAPAGEVAVVVTEVEKGVDEARVAKDAGHDQMATPPPSMSVTRPLSPRYRENLHLASCNTPSVKMIWLQHDTTTCIFSLLPFLSRLLF